MSSVISLKIHIIVQIDAESTQPVIAPLDIPLFAFGVKRELKLVIARHEAISKLYRATL